MDELIRKQDAVETAKHAWAKGLEPSQYIEIIPPIQPKCGEWEYHSNPTIGINPEDAYCSCCGFHVDTTDDIDFDEYNFCPRCGAKMERNEDGTD